MTAKKWAYLWFVSIFFLAIVTMLINYFIDPYGIYNTNLLKIKKTRQSNKGSLVKIIEVKNIKPASLAVGDSRVHKGINVEHPYFIQPAYNAGLGSQTMYESRKFFEYALKFGNLKKVLLGLSYVSFNRPMQKTVSDFESYFNMNYFKYILTYDQLIDSIFTILKIMPTQSHFKNGVADPNFGLKKIIENGTYLHNFKALEKNFYRDISTDYRYKDTGRNSFEDFELIVKKCYENNISLDMIISPTHVRLWEVLDYKVGYDRFLKWKKDVVVAVDKISKKYNKKPFRIFDFAVYHKLTNEKIPEKPGIEMRYFRDTSHFTFVIGNIILDRLMGKTDYEDFGVELNTNNIDEHLKKLKNDRAKFIDTEVYIKEVFSK